MSTSVQERHELGRACRAALPQSALADFASGPQRPDPITLLQYQEQRQRLPARVDADEDGRRTRDRLCAGITRMALDCADEHRPSLFLSA